MSIKEVPLPNGKIVYDVYVHVSDGRGGRLQKRRRKVPTLKAAKDAEALMMAGLLLEKGRPGRVTWSLWFEKCMEQMQVTHRPTTIENYRLMLGRWVTPQFGDRFLDEITPAEIHRLLYDQRPKASMSTRRTVLDIIRRFFGRAVDEGLLTRNPALPIKVKVPQPIQSVLNATEVQTLLREAMLTGHRFYPIWAAALFTGMRSGELYALRWSDVDLENRRIYVTRSWNNKSGFGPTKSQRNRVVPISDSLVKLLAELRLANRSSRAEEDFILPHLQEWTDGEQAAVLRRFCKLIGITSIKFHDLRATFITQLLLKGVPLAQVMAIAGHTEIGTTNGYLRVAGSDLEGTTNKLSYSLPEERLAQVIELRS
ncbi:MAG: site-specific integrase [Bdellovibrionales bacterium]|nr:site-specific integrase [Bdellovibrionales bacterium]